MTLAYVVPALMLLGLFIGFCWMAKALRDYSRRMQVRDGLYQQADLSKHDQLVG